MKTSKKQWLRVVMDQAVDNFIGNMPIERWDCLEISPAKDSRFAKLPWKKYLAPQYPQFDIQSVSADRLNSYDVIIADQVLEHIPNAKQAVQNMYHLLKKGGVVIVSAPFLVKVHLCPGDFHRWTPDGFRRLIEDGGFCYPLVYSWGNRICVIEHINAPVGAWLPYNAKRHSLENDPAYPIVVWAFARKPF